MWEAYWRQSFLHPHQLCSLIFFQNLLLLLYVRPPSSSYTFYQSLTPVYYLDRLYVSVTFHQWKKAALHFYFRRVVSDHFLRQYGPSSSYFQNLLPAGWRRVVVPVAPVLLPSYPHWLLSLKILQI